MLLEHYCHPPVVHVENEVASLFLEGRAEIHTYRTILDMLAGLAMDEGQSREFLATLASEYDRVEEARDDHAQPSRAELA